MRTQLSPEPASVASVANMTHAEWSDYKSDCLAAMAQGGDRARIAERMLAIGERMRALSAKVDDALAKFSS